MTSINRPIISETPNFCKKPYVHSGVNSLLIFSNIVWFSTEWGAVLWKCFPSVLTLHIFPYRTGGNEVQEPAPFV